LRDHRHPAQRARGIPFHGIFEAKFESSPNSIQHLYFSRVLATRGGPRLAAGTCILPCF
jgi:hypothetical protein